MTNPNVPPVAQERHKGKYKGQSVEIYQQRDGDPLTDGWYVDDGTTKIKATPQTIFTNVQVDDFQALVQGIIDTGKERLIARIEEITTMEDFFEVAPVLHELQAEAAAVREARDFAMRQVSERMGGA